MERIGFRLGSGIESGQGTLVSFFPDLLLPLLTSQVCCGTHGCIHQGLAEIHELVLVPRTETATSQLGRDTFLKESGSKTQRMALSWSNLWSLCEVLATFKSVCLGEGENEELCFNGYRV